MVTPLQDLQSDWKNWTGSDQKVLTILRGLIELPFAFALWIRLTLQIGTLNFIQDYRGEPHPDIEGSTDLSARSPIREPSLEPGDDLYLRVVSSGMAIVIFSTPIFPLVPDEPHAIALLYANFGLLVVDPLLFYFGE